VLSDQDPPSSSTYILPPHVTPYLEAVWNISSDAMALSDAEGTVLAINPAYAELYGYTPEETVGKPFSIIFPEEERPAAQEQYRTAFWRAPAAAVYDAVVRRADGQVRLVESRVAFVEKNNVRVAMISVVRDVTQYKQAEIELADNRTFLHHVLAALPDFVVVHDRMARRDTLFNDRLHDILGASRYSGATTTESDFLNQFHPDDLVLFQAAQEKVSRAADGELVDTELRMRHADGSWRLILMRQTVVRRNSQDEPQQVLTLLRDISPQKATPAPMAP
jgi:PAS domain S-box-containing protein